MNILLFSPLQIILDEEKYYSYKEKNTLYTIEFYNCQLFLFTSRILWDGLAFNS